MLPEELRWSSPGVQDFLQWPCSQALGMAEEEALAWQPRLQTGRWVLGCVCSQASGDHMLLAEQLVSCTP